jgi:hypothetical protein
MSYYRHHPDFPPRQRSHTRCILARVNAPAAQSGRLRQQRACVKAIQELLGRVLGVTDADEL